MYDHLEVAPLFEKYRYDRNYFSLYIWAYAMIMIDHYSAFDMFLDDMNFEDIEGDLEEIGVEFYPSELT